MRTRGIMGTGTATRTGMTTRVAMGTEATTRTRKWLLGWYECSGAALGGVCLWG